MCHFAYRASRSAPVSQRRHSEEATMGEGRRRSRKRDGLEEPLTPVRWRRPGRGLLVRLAAVAALLVTAAAVTWVRPASSGCAPQSAAGADPNSPAAGADRSSSAAGADRSSSAGTPRGGDPVRGASATPRGGDPPAGAPARATVPQGTVGVPVRLAEPTALALVHPGDRVDLLRVDATGGDSAVVAAAALVLGVTSADDPTTGGLLLALKPIEAAKAMATAGHGFAVIIRPN
jgi:hypothetical protein